MHLERKPRQHSKSATWQKTNPTQQARWQKTKAKVGRIKLPKKPAKVPHVKLSAMGILEIPLGFSFNIKRSRITKEQSTTKHT